MRTLFAAALLAMLFTSCNRETRSTSASANPATPVAVPIHTPPSMPPMQMTSTTAHDSGPRATPKSLEELALTVKDPGGLEPENIRMVYANARLVADRLDKMYCYCQCHEHMGHRSLLTCFQGTHAAECDVCLREGYQAWLDWKEGRPVQETQKTADAIYNGGLPPPSLPQ